MNFQKVAQEVFTILHSYNYDVSLYDEDSNQVFEPDEARRFQSTKKDLLVAIIDEGENSKIKLYFRKDIPAESLTGLMDTLRMTATKYNMTFSSRRKDHDITPKDYSTKMAMSESRAAIAITEGMYGTSRSSYLRLENARMIVRHSARINEDLMGARGRNIDSIYIENGQGERMLFPTKQLAPARSMAHHVSNGGSWADDGGQDICRLANEYADLREMSRHIHRNASQLDEGAHKVREHCREGMRKLRKTFESICRKTRYEDVMQSLKKPLNEQEVDVSEAVSKLKSCCHVDECEIEPRVYETAARCVREADDFEATKRMTTVAGVRVSRETWKGFVSGELALSEHLHEPKNVEGYREFNTAALKSIGTACKDPQMTAVFAAIAEQFETGKVERSAKAFAAQALKIVGWSTPKPIAAMDPVREYADWMGSHTAEKAVGEHCGTCKADLDRNEEEADEAPEELDEDDAYITQGIKPDEDDLTLDDIIIPTDQGESLKDEVTVNTVVNPDTGHEELPSTGYVQRLRSLAGIKKGQDKVMY